MSAFSNQKTVRLMWLAALSLAIVGIALYVIPNRILFVLGMDTTSQFYFWQRLVGAGFVTAGWLATQFIAGRREIRAVYEAFFIASLMAIIAIVLEFKAGSPFSMFVLGFCAVVILVLSIKGTLGSK